MTHYLIRLLLFTVLLIQGSTAEEFFMDNELIEIREFSPLGFNDDVLDEASENYFDALVGTIKSYQDNNQSIKVKVLGHSNARVDIYDKVIASEDQYNRLLKNTVVCTRKVVQRLVENGLTYDLVDIYYKNSKNLGFTNLAKEGKNLSNHVIVTMYVYASAKTTTKKEVRTPFMVESKNVKDSDEDGVLDSVDVEQNTPVSYAVDNEGHAISVRFASAFKKNSLEPDEALRKEIKKLAHYLSTNPFTKVHIVGHTSRTEVSGMAYNIRLSLQRAKRVKQELLNYGVDTTRITTDGKGFNEPIADNAKEEGRLMNRRIEIQMKKLKTKEIE